MTVMIPRKTAFPVQKMQTFTTFADDRSSVTIKVFEGERSKTTDNNLLGTFELIDIPKAPKGVPQIEVTFDANEICDLNVSALEKSTGNVKKITISNENGRLSYEEINKMINDAKKFKEQDNEVLMNAEAKNSLE